jgi:HAMP domain-containing protein
MLKRFQLRQKFSIVLVLILLGGIALSGLTMSTALRKNASEEVTATALLLMETMNSVRDYTGTQVRPELVDRLDVEFLPETVPAYSAREVFEKLRESSNYDEFFYKEATLNPTNLRDKADDFEARLVEDFKANPNKTELEGYRVSQGRDIFYIARPIKITQASCLECHGRVEDAPKSMIDFYGPERGFGWQMDEIVGAQMISVPASRVINKANRATLLMVSIVSGIFALILLLVNWLLSRQVIRPLQQMAKVAEEVSRGNLEAEFIQDSQDEVGTLAKSFTRMQRSLMLAMERIGRTQSRSKNSGAQSNSSPYDVSG